MVDGVQVTLFEGDGLLVATQVLNHQQNPHHTRFREAAVDTPRLQALFPLYIFHTFDSSIFNALHQSS